MERGEGAGGGRGGRADLRGAAKENVWFDAESGGQGAEDAQVAIVALPETAPIIHACCVYLTAVSTVSASDLSTASETLVMLDYHGTSGSQKTVESMVPA